ncbi:putative ankyrin repeat protein [Acanthamoeba polyphaga mimivirus]|uniref:Ankyrin repeat protein n=1 Tax=Acanthamoeba polyphaga mimivirus Kroon TaxID=3069720 RepID=A0A0G2Y7I3_9VIRU|nr:putative ankyrin repeat protein [Acanthamoeba polyphaga mimivirus]AKI80504.1 putative ankyrin repeat protein [Acanthamoeba polyphaga mimivirus Kroon]
MSTMARHNNNYSIDYLKLNGYYIDNNILKDFKLVNFMNEIGINIFSLIY